MASFPFGFIKELEQVGRAIQNSESWEEFFGSFQRMYQESPRTSVHDVGSRLKVVVEAPGLSNKMKHQWSFRVLDQILYIRGVLNQQELLNNEEGHYYNELHHEQFTRAVPLPSTVRRKPISIHYRDGLFILLFEKKKGVEEEEWYSLDWNKS